MLALILLLALGAGYAAFVLMRPYAAFTGEKFLEFPKGTSTAEMADSLDHAGVIPHAWEFLLVRALRPHRALQAGEYRFAKPESVMEVYDRIARGDVFYYTLVVPEGQNMFDIAAATKVRPVSGGRFSESGPRRILHPRSRSRRTNARGLFISQQLPA